MKTVYLVGSVTGNEKAEEQFAYQESIFRGMGFRVINPIKLCRENSVSKWTDCILFLLRFLTQNRIDCFFVVNEIENSVGAQIEKLYLSKMGVQHLTRWEYV